MVFKEYMAPMSDGTRLYTRCTLPDDSGRFPIIFSRSPYDDRAYIPAEHPGDFDACIRAGYAVVHQSCRGTARSEGVFVPFAMERSDGLDTLAWLRRQSFYGGEIYPQGASYCSYVHLAYLGTHQSDVKGAFLYVMPTDMYAGMTVNGLFKQDIITPWFSQQYHKNQCDSSAIQANYPALTLRRPHYAALDPYYEGGCPDYAAYLRSHEIWKSVPGPGEALNAMRDLTVPVLLMEGWYDIYIGAGTAMWEELPESVRAKSALLVGPWPHSCRVSRDWVLEMPGGERPADLMLNWFNHLRAGEKLNFMREGQIRYTPSAKTPGISRRICPRDGARSRSGSTARPVWGQPPARGASVPTATIRPIPRPSPAAQTPSVRSGAALCPIPSRIRARIFSASSASRWLRTSR